MAVLANLEAEQSVLGSLLMDRMAVYEVRAMLGASDFAYEDHADIYRSALAVVDSGSELDAVTLTDDLQRRDKLARIGHDGATGPAYITWLIGHVPTAMHARHYAQIVHDYSVRRQLLDAAGRIAREAHDAESAEDALTTGLTLLTSVNQQMALEMSSSGDAVDDFLIDVQDWLTNPREVWGLPTGIKDLDQLTGGIEPTELVLLAGRPSMGKSALALQIARHVAEQGYGVAFFSLEMGLKQLMMRMVCSGARVNSYALKRGKLDEAGKEKLWQEMAHVQTLPIWWCCRSGIKVHEATNEVAKLQTRGDLSLVVFDYLQLSHGEGENQNIRVSRISQGLAHMAKSLNCCVLALSQLNRAIEKRSDPTPIMSDLRDSGSLEQDADKILFVHREPANLETRISEARLVLAKNRNGKAGAGSRDLVFLEEYATFVDKARGAYIER